MNQGPRRCGRCGTTYESVDHLLPMTRYSASELAPVVVSWPANLIVDVRKCQRCDSPIACLAKTVSG